MINKKEVPSCILTAVSKAAWLHRYQRRKGSQKIPYINHPVKVALMLGECGHRYIELLQAAVLHDVIEDTGYTLAQLAEEFSEKVAGIVAEMTDDMSLPSKKRKKLQVVHAPELSADAAKIKIADKACNINDILEYDLSWSQKRKLNYVVWANDVVGNIKSPDTCLLKEFRAISERAMNAFS